MTWLILRSENPRYYLCAMVCSCNDGHTYSTMTTGDTSAPCGFTVSPGPPLLTMPVVTPSPTPEDPPALRQLTVSGLPTMTASKWPVPSDDSMEVCAGTNQNGVSDIFTCNGNATLFQIFAPAGTPHSSGLADNDQQGFGTWEGGGCVCQGGDFCCIEGARVPVSFDSGKFDGITTDGSDPANVALALNYFTWLKGACGCNGDIRAVNKRYLEEIPSDPHIQNPEAKRPRLEYPGRRRLQTVAGKSYRRSVVAQELTDYGDEPALVRKAIHDKVWNMYRDKGQIYWGRFNRRDINQPDYDPCDLDGLYTTPDDQVKVKTTLSGKLNDL